MMGKEETKITEASVKFQYLAALVVNMLTVGYGVTSGWSSPSILLLKSDESPLPTGKITTEESSWIASLISIGALIGNIVCGYASNKFGRKLPLLFLTIPTIIGWTLVLFAKNVFYLYASRALNGFVGGGVFVIIPTFLSEIAVDRVRGSLGSTLALAWNVGILLAFTFGNYLDFNATPKFVIALMILTAVLLCFFPESPTFLYKQNKILEAEKSIRFYQNLTGKANDYELLQIELNKLKTMIGNVEKNESNSKLSWSDLLNGPGKKAMMIGIVLSLLNQFCGCFAMLNYTANIFKEAGSSVSPNKSAIVVGVIKLIGSYISTNLVDRAGRKFLFIVSSIGIALGLSTLGVYMLLKTRGYPIEAYNWIPLVSFSFVIFIANWAVLTLTFLVISEIMPENLKSFGSSFCMVLLWTSSFFVIKFLPLMTETLEIHGTMFLFSGLCLCGTTFIVFYMPETKGRSYVEIMKLLE
ncbi:facilitated trehalose transporter Tret1-like [Contarinia nasturtii]|uniref:facilitated trehalose transporter Tret1-like n=1 Tax=Contarinia nasturtii TaxID=265458 RepID=UPI0012D46247|nr:facilitated trehalose transporter Tret1-like [Contarinia nasturtii]